MVSNVIASAPGKVVLCGEYAVLDAAPAIAMAVDRRARATLAISNEASSVVTAKAYTKNIGRFQTRDGSIEWQEGQQYFGVIDSVWRAAELSESRAMSIELDSSEFIDSNSHSKLGVGSSAAITVALCAAVGGTADIEKIGPTARRAHLDLQDGAGSGVDIACSLNGGLIEYRMAGQTVTPISWPQGLFWRLIWTGVAASTRDKISKLDAAVSKPSRTGLADASESMMLAWRCGSADRVMSEYGHYIEQLREFSVDHDLGIFDAGHNDIHSAASAANLVYKPCGAGGGDVGIVFSRSAAELDVFAKQLPDKYTVLDCQLSKTGVLIEEMKIEQA